MIIHPPSMGVVRIKEGFGFICGEAQPKYAADVGCSYVVSVSYQWFLDFEELMPASLTAASTRPNSGTV